MDLNEKESKRIINALKSGVVPDSDLRAICAGRDREIDEFKRCMEFTKENNSIIKFITGAYGSGKSFLLSVIKQVALEENFVVATIKIDKNFKFNKGEDIYYQIMHNLSIGNSETEGTSFEEIFGLWIDNLQRDKDTALEKISKVITVINDYNSSFAIAFTSYIKAKINKDTDLSNAVSAWIKGEKNVSAALKSKFNMKANVDRTNYMSFMKAFIKLVTLLGYSGLIVLVDELELIVNDRSTIRETTYENLRNIIDMSAAGEINNSMFIFAATNELFENEEKGIRTYAALYNRLSSSYETDRSSLVDLRQPIIKIKGLMADDLVQLTKKIVNIHKVVYKWNPKIKEDILQRFAKTACYKFGNQLTEANTRQYLKKVVDALDIMEQNPGVDIFRDEVSASEDLIPPEVKHKVETSKSIIDSILDDPLFGDDIIKFN